MKSKKLALLGAGILMLTLTGCFSVKPNFDYKERAKEGTPENSVILIGYFGCNGQMCYSQCDSEYAPDYQELVGPFIVSAPVAPGSRYRLEYVSGSETVGRTTYYWYNTYPLGYNWFDIKVPDEPGIYYFGYYYGRASYREGEPKAYETTLFYKPNPVKEERDCLQAALNVYRGTEWEAVIKERIGELKK